MTPEKKSIGKLVDIKESLDNCDIWKNILTPWYQIYRELI